MTSGAVKSRANGGNPDILQPLGIVFSKLIQALTQPLLV
jgi:hypothetical protein